MILQVVNVVYHVYPADVAPGAVSLLAKDISHNDAPLKRQVGLEQNGCLKSWLDSDGLRDSRVKQLIYIYCTIYEISCYVYDDYTYKCYILYLYVNNKGS